MKHIVDHGTKRSKTDTTGDEEKVLPFQFCLYREMISVRSADSNLITHIQAVEMIRQFSAFFDTELLVLFYGRRRSDGKHSFADTRYADHRALTRHMLKKLASLRCFHTEGLDIRSFLTDVCDHANLRDQGVQGIIFVTGTFTHSLAPPCFSKALMTFTIFKDEGHFSTQRPQPTQEYMPSLFAGKYTSLCMKR